MRSQLIRWGLLGVLILPLFSGAADTPANPNAVTLGDLRRRVAELEVEVKLHTGEAEQLSKSASKLKLQFERWPTTRPNSKTILSGEPSTIPSGAIPFKFNGMTYYIVPVGK